MITGTIIEIASHMNFTIFCETLSLYLDVNIIIMIKAPNSTTNKIISQKVAQNLSLILYYIYTY